MRISSRSCDRYSFAYCSARLKSTTRLARRSWAASQRSCARRGPSRGRAPAQAQTRKMYVCALSATRGRSAMWIYKWHHGRRRGQRSTQKRRPRIRTLGHEAHLLGLDGLGAALLASLGILLALLEQRLRNKLGRHDWFERQPNPRFLTFRGCRASSCASQQSDTGPARSERSRAKVDAAFRAQARREPLRARPAPPNAPSSPPRASRGGPRRVFGARPHFARLRSIEIAPPRESFERRASTHRQLCRCTDVEKANLLQARSVGHVSRLFRLSRRRADRSH